MVAGAALGGHGRGVGAPAAALAVAFSLEAAGTAYPATWGEVTAAVCLVVGGPLLMRALRRIMLDNAAESDR